MSPLRTGPPPGNPPPRRPRRDEGIQAQHDGHCEWCGDDIEAGRDRIVQREGWGWVHAIECGEEIDARGTRRGGTVTPS